MSRLRCSRFLLNGISSTQRVFQFAIGLTTSDHVQIMHFGQL